MSFADTPLTRLAGTAQQRIAPDPAPTIDAIARYAESDMLCYRAETPEELVARQMRAWQPWLDWAALTYDAPLRVGCGIAYVKQHREQRCRAARRGGGARRPGAGGARALRCRRWAAWCSGWRWPRAGWTPRTAHALGALDELFQAEAWGEDAEAAARRAAIAADVAVAARFLQLTRPAEPT